MNDSAKLTDEELREAAAEAGISPEELRQALVKRSGDLPATRGPTLPAASSLEGRVALPPEHASEAVRRVIEKRSGRRGHRQGGGRIDIVDDDNGVVYRIQGEADGAGGALVKVEVDPMSGVGNFALGALIVGAFSLGLIAFGWFLSTLVLIGGVVLGGAGVFALIGARRRLEGARQIARQIAAEALLEAEDAPPPTGPVALPPIGRGDR